MSNEKRRFLVRLVGVAFAGAIMVTGCAPKAMRQPTGSLDTPQHHVFSGNKLLQAGQWDEAGREFNLALELDPKHAPAHQGLGLALGFKGDFKAGFQAMGDAKWYAHDKQEEAMAFVGYMRLYTMQKEKGWLENVENACISALSKVEDMPDAPYYLGIAYKEAYEFPKADKQFKKVLSINKTLVAEADRELKLVQKIERAMPGTDAGKKMALQEKISRADCAAIFVHELRVDKIYEKEKEAVATLKAIPKDVTDHALRTDIEAILRIGMRGLEVFPDGNFRPDDLITRAAYAMMIEDMIATATHDPQLSTRHIGQPSPFPDVRSDAASFNAVMVCTTRGIMEPADVLKGQFKPEGPITGADALLVIRKLREELRVF